MKIEIFVVKTLNPSQIRLDSIKADLIKLFNGLTIIPNCEGFFKDSDTIWHDKVEIWQIYTNLGKRTAKKTLKWHLEGIKNTTQQKSQAYALNNEIFLI